MAVFLAWRTATLIPRDPKSKVPALSRLLARPSRKATDREAVQQRIAEAAAEFARLEALAAEGRSKDGR